MTWGLSANGHTDPANLDQLKAIFNDAATKAKELCPDSFSVRYWDDNGQATLPEATAAEAVQPEPVAPSDTSNDTPAAADTTGDAQDVIATDPEPSG